MFSLQDLEYKKFYSKLCPGTHNIIGVRVPEIRKLAKRILTEAQELKYIENQEKEYYEEIMLEGLLIALAKIPITEKLKYLDTFISKIDNWSICDICAASFKFSIEDQDVIWKYLLKYHKSDSEFELRFMIVMWLNHYLKTDYHSDILHKIDQITADEYYVKMAIAWLLAMDYFINKEQTLEYLKHNHLSNWTYNKSIQKIIESTRLTEDEKKKLKEMKRNKK